MSRPEREIRTCESCGMSVMGQGDIQNWKALGDDQAKLYWYCTKELCLKAHDEHVSKLIREMNPDMTEEDVVEYMRQNPQG